MERTQNKKSFKSCCHHGKVRLLPLVDYPIELRGFFTRQHPKSANFLEHIRRYNSALAFASVNAEQDPLMKTPGTYLYKIHGQIYHTVAKEIQTDQPKYSQVYILDSEEAIRERLKQPVNTGCLAEVCNWINFVYTFNLSNFH